MQHIIFFILAVLLLVGYIDFKREFRFRLNHYLTFVQYSKALCEIYESYKRMSPQQLEQHTEFESESLRVDYNPEELSKFFFQFDLMLVKMLDEYDILLAMEYSFTKEDWTYIQDVHDKLLEMQSDLKMERWRKGLIKV